jgi:zinc transport system substrate-binding protein
VSVLALLCVLSVGCSSGVDAPPEEGGEAGLEPSVYAVNYPLAYFARRIGDGSVEVVFPVPDGVDPAFWSPGPEAVRAFQQSDLILLNGAGYAKWVGRVSLPPSKLVDTSRAYADRLIRAADTVTHSHGPQGEHSHGEVAFTTWLDPTLAIEQARAIVDAISGLRPEEAGALEARFERLERDWSALDAELSSAFASRPDEPLLGSHPVYQYLARRYSLNLESVHFEPDEVPDQAAWTELETLLGHHPARWMLWESEPLAETRSRLEQLGVATVVFDPCAGRPETGDLLTTMRSNVENLRTVFAAR